MTRTIRIGGASGYWGDAAMATPQLLARAELDYIVYDYLAEITMSVLAKARERNPEGGFAGDFVNFAMAPNLREIARKGVKIVSNAGGVNPRACAAAVRKLVQDQGLDLKVAAVVGDDLSERAGDFAEAGVADMFSGAAFPDVDAVRSVNAYLGAFPIAAALGAGADIVIAGRCVDSATTLGACIHEFGWGAEDLDRLAGGSLAGHVIECGAQATGGNFTDWAEIAETIVDIGYPIAEISEDGTFVCTKPEGTGGRVSRGTVGEQLLYEIGDPQAYLLPDVACDFSEVVLEEEGEDRVRVSGARGAAAPETLKVCATYADGYRAGGYFTFYGAKAEDAARAFSGIAVERARRVLRAVNLPDFVETSVEILGAESHYGEDRTAPPAREVVAKIAAKHESEIGAGVLLREAVGAGLASPPGLSGFTGVRSKPSEVVRLFSFTVPRGAVSPAVEIDRETVPVEPTPGAPFDPAALERPKPPAPPEGETVEVPLVKLAFARSGDKGDYANVGLLARRADYFPWLCAGLTEEVVARRFAHFLEGRVTRYLLPGLPALNFLLEGVLGGGGVSSLRNDAQGKGFGQLLLDMTIPVSADLAARDGLKD